MSKPTTPTGERMLERSAWDEGLRCHRVRLLNPAGPEDLSNAILAIEAEAREEGISIAAKRVESLWRPGDSLADIVSHIRGEHP